MSGSDAQVAFNLDIGPALIYIGSDGTATRLDAPDRAQLSPRERALVNALMGYVAVQDDA